jgi:hypothetical protein
MDESEWKRMKRPTSVYLFNLAVQMFTIKCDIRMHRHVQKDIHKDGKGEDGL